MNAAAIVTYVLAVVAAVSAVAILFVKEVFYAALFLVICLLCVAGIFVTFNSEFLAVVQLVVYAGGVLLLIIFGIMLTVRDGLQEPSNNKLLSVVIGLSLFSVIVYSLEGIMTGNPNPELSPETIGALLMTRFAIPFEVAGVLLLVSLIGAIVAATTKSQT